MRQTIERLLSECPGGEPEYFETSEWFDDDTIDQVDNVIQEYAEAYQTKKESGDESPHSKE